MLLREPVRTPVWLRMVYVRYSCFVNGKGKRRTRSSIVRPRWECLKVKYSANKSNSAAIDSKNKMWFGFKVLSPPSKWQLWRMQSWCRFSFDDFQTENETSLWVIVLHRFNLSPPFPLTGSRCVACLCLFLVRVCLWHQKWTHIPTHRSTTVFYNNNNNNN